MVQFSHPYMSTGKTIALTIWTFVGKVMSLFFNTLSVFMYNFIYFILVKICILEFTYMDFYALTACMYSVRRRQWQPTPVLLPGKSHGWRSLVGCSPWGHQESDTTERLHFHFSLSCIGEGNGKPLQCSCQENPRDGGGWWAAVYGVAQSWT